MCRTDILRHMAGSELTEIFPARGGKKGEIRRRVKKLTRKGKFRDVSFAVAAGEVIGIAGLAGAGRTELVETVFGAYRADGGEVFLDGSRLHPAQPDLTVARGLGLLTEDRKRTGLCLNQPLAGNLTLANLRALTRGWLLDRRRENAGACEHIERLHIRPSDPDKTVALVNGANQQKVFLRPSV